MSAHTAKSLPCPFCGARPHHGLGKVEHCSLHGEPFQRFNIWCPKGHAKVSGANEELANREWNTRPHAVSAAEGDLLGLALEALRFAKDQLDDLINRHYGGDIPCSDEEYAGFELIDAILSQAQAREVTR